jgi:hypothetical protein
VILHLRSSHNQVAGRFISVIVKGRRTGRTVDETLLPRRRANASRRAATFFPLAASYRFYGDQGAR